MNQQEDCVGTNLGIVLLSSNLPMPPSLLVCFNYLGISEFLARRQPNPRPAADKKVGSVTTCSLPLLGVGQHFSTFETMEPYGRGGVWNQTDSVVMDGASLQRLPCQGACL